MDLSITKAKPEFSMVGHSKNVLYVEFPNCISTKTNRSFKWMPTYKQLEEIKKALDEIEVESWNGGKQNGQN